MIFLKPFTKKLITNIPCYVDVLMSQKQINLKDRFTYHSWFIWFEIKHISVNSDSIIFKLSDGPYDLPSKIIGTSLENIYLSDIENIFDDSIRIIKSHEIKENPELPISEIWIINSRNVRVN